MQIEDASDYQLGGSSQGTKWFSNFYADPLNLFYQRKGSVQESLIKF